MGREGGREGGREREGEGGRAKLALQFGYFQRTHSPRVELRCPRLSQVRVTERQVAGGDYRVGPDSRFRGFLQNCEQQLKVAIAHGVTAGNV